MADEFLFPEQVMAEITEAERRGEYTLERLREVRPGVIEAVLELTAQGYSTRRVCEVLKPLSRNTVSSILSKHPDRLREMKYQLASKVRTAAEVQLDRLIEEPEKVPMQAAMIGTCALIDKYQLLMGEATGRIEVSYVDVNEMIDELRRMNERAREKAGDETINVQCVEATPALGTGDGHGNNG
jgi:hypothetical protein